MTFPFWKKKSSLFQPSFVCRVLRCLEGVHPSQSGALLILLIPRLLGLPHLALARLAGKLACRRAELLLTLSTDEVASQLTEADLRRLMDILHSTSLARKWVSPSNQKQGNSNECHRCTISNFKLFKQIFHNIFVPVWPASGVQTLLVQKVLCSFGRISCAVQRTCWCLSWCWAVVSVSCLCATDSYEHKK